MPEKTRSLVPPDSPPNLQQSLATPKFVVLTESLASVQEPTGARKSQGTYLEDSDLGRPEPRFS
jgi:hypothetical protein